MSQKPNVLDPKWPKESYEARYLENFAKSIEMPSFEYLDVMFHPYLKDHIIVLSKNSFGDGNSWE